MAAWKVKSLEDYDARLEKAGRTDLQGRLAVDNAKIVYQEFKEIFSGEDWDYLVSKGASKQRPLCASTSTKNAAAKERVAWGVVGAAGLVLAGLV